MPKVVNGKWKIVNRIKQSIHHSQLTIHLEAFSLIELLIVISLFGLAASLITAAYLSFERVQKVKNAALTLKNDIRLVQSKAHTGDKGPDKLCGQGGLPLDVQLLGWFVTFAKTTNSYTLTALCRKGGTDYEIPESPIVLPDGLSISDITLDNNLTAITSWNVLFQPLTADARFYNDQYTPPFILADGTEPNRQGIGGTLNIIITGSGGSYHVDITSNGEVNERR